MGKIITDMQLVPIDKLIPYVNNARTHSKEQITKLRSSIREFGFINPVIIDRDYGIIAGHGRVMAAKAEGITDVPCVFVEVNEYYINLKPNKKPQVPYKNSTRHCMALYRP